MSALDDALKDFKKQKGRNIRDAILTNSAIDAVADVEAEVEAQKAKAITAKQKWAERRAAEKEKAASAAEYDLLNTW